MRRQFASLAVACASIAFANVASAHINPTITTSPDKLGQASCFQKISFLDPKILTRPTVSIGESGRGSGSGESARPRTAAIKLVSSQGSICGK
jgi:hypothetical protein